MWAIYLLSYYLKPFISMDHRRRMPFMPCICSTSWAMVSNRWHKSDRINLNKANHYTSPLKDIKTPRHTECPVDSAAKLREPFKNISFRKKYFTDKKQKIELCKIKTTFQQPSYIYFSHNSLVPSGISPEKRKGCDYNWIFSIKRVINIQSNIQLFSWW